MRPFYYSKIKALKLSVLMLMFFTHISSAQNLVINPSFEDVNVGSLQCSWYTTQAQFNTAINNWTCPTGGSTDIFNTALATTCYCSPFSTNASSPGTQAPRTGNGFVNIVTYGNGGCDPWREYVQGQLSSPLVVGQTYEVEMWVTLADKMSVGTNNIGVKFSTNPYTQASNCGYYTTPDLNYTGPIILDKSNWVQIIFCYTPTVAGLDNFIIGNFYNDAATSTAPAAGVTTGNTIRYFIDDVRIQLATGSGNAGTPGTLNACTSDGPTDLFNALGGTPDASGTWSGPSALGGGNLGTFDPAVNAQGVYTYSVSGGGFCAAGSPSSATVTVAVSNPAANIPAAGPYCSGDVFALSENGGSGTTWSWTSDGGATITNSTDQNPTITGATNGETFTVVATDAGGCSASDQLTVTVNPLPTVNASNTGPYCVGDPVAVGESGGQATSWNWTSNGSATFTNATDQNPSVSGAVSGEIFTVTATSAAGCTSTAQTTVTIDPIPVFTISNSTDPSSCITADGDFTLSGLDPSTGYSLSYSDDGTPVGPMAITTDASGNYTVSGLDGGSYTSISLTAGSCTYTDGPVNLVSPTSPSFTVTYTDPSTCAATDGTITLSGLQPSTNYDLSYSDDGTGVGPMTILTDGSGNYSISGLDAGTYNNLIVDLAGCQGSDPGTYNLIEPPIPQLDPVSDVVNCGDFTLPAITGTNLTGNQAYFNDSQVNGGTVISGPITTTQMVYIFDGSGGCTDEESFLVTIEPLPAVTNVYGGGAYCEGDVVGDIFVEATGNTNWTVTYTIDNGAPATVSGSTSPLSLGNSPGIYTLISIDDVNCSATASGTQTITVSPVPNPPVALQDTSYCSSENYAGMTATGTGGTYTWYSDSLLNNAIANGATLVPLDQVGTTTYYVTETVNGCESEASFIQILIEACDITVPTAITPNNDGNNDNWEILELDNVYPDNTVRIYNRWGNLLFEHISDNGAKPYDQNRWDGTFNGEALPVGSYFFIIEFNDKDNGSMSGSISILLD